VMAWCGCDGIKSRIPGGRIVGVDVQSRHFMSS
jgi:hypothetical protein